ncbi:uncharacterized protein [Miscanthus floridulus]|uniref:uncharacterized protein n=1 Tax=Miscanthus floridulus TaxID=154761 RepID=UPI003459EA66
MVEEDVRYRSRRVGVAKSDEVGVLGEAVNDDEHPDRAKSVVLTVVDHFSKYAHFIALGHPYTATTVARVFFDHIVRLHDIPCSIISDRDPVFTSTFWTELFALSGVDLRLSSTFHPQNDGQSEVTNRVVYGWAPPTMASYQPDVARVTALDKQLRDRDAFLAEIREWLLHVRDHMKLQYDAGHIGTSSSTLDTGCGSICTIASLLATPTRAAAKCRRATMAHIRSSSVLAQWRIVFSWPPKAKIHDVFHVVFLKQFVGTPSAAVVPLPLLSRGCVVPMPESIVRTRLNRGCWELLVQWVGRPAAEATWEALDTFKEAHPKFQLEDELFPKKTKSTT